MHCTVLWRRCARWLNGNAARKGLVEIKFKQNCFALQPLFRHQNRQLECTCVTGVCSLCSLRFVNRLFAQKSWWPYSSVVSPLQELCHICSRYQHTRCLQYPPALLLASALPVSRVVSTLAKSACASSLLLQCCPSPPSPPPPSCCCRSQSRAPCTCSPPCPASRRRGSPRRPPPRSPCKRSGRCWWLRSQNCPA